ncbi:hypothetical protein PN466_21025 [Roseofilum reptotaenium CS-1145]|uniref:Uncharacterized protein n=1 Tax=Roseofilum reptotaenium AO1-A TaxID=1925591 RepID=A0A1L9QLN7_9CYAN|nr:hypothetical protein [Roseofilum reptotaenium]MDB9519430.1 hypothetical protein [Roseofilum reptotaenium CS-1145]OJJ19799.1 hypothetical protein BI308_21050 [Roseofilum reptotaenium AO1-A]
MTSINQAVYVSGTTSYKFLQDDSANLSITKVPEDANLRRWAMLHDGDTYRLYCFQGSSQDKLYQFGWTGREYEYGHDSEPELTITNIPEDADTNSFSMLYGENNYRLYFRQLGNPTKLYEFIWDGKAYAYAAAHPVSGFPHDTDWSRWSMLNDGDTYRIYAFKLGSNSAFYQGAWNGSKYEYGYGGSYKELTLEDTPPNSDFANMELLHDGSQYHFYLQAL